MKTKTYNATHKSEWKNQMSFVLRKWNQVKQVPNKSLKGYQNNPTGELKVYQKALGISPAETQSAAWVLSLALAIFLLLFIIFGG